MWFWRWQAMVVKKQTQLAFLLANRTRVGRRQATHGPAGRPRWPACCATSSASDCAAGRAVQGRVQHRERVAPAREASDVNSRTRSRHARNAEELDGLESSDRLVGHDAAQLRNGAATWQSDMWTGPTRARRSRAASPRCGACDAPSGMTASAVPSRTSEAVLDVRVAGDLSQSAARRRVRTLARLGSAPKSAWERRTSRPRPRSAEAKSTAS